MNSLNGKANQDPNAAYLYYTNPQGYQSPKKQAGFICFIIILGITLGIGLVLGIPFLSNCIQYNIAMNASTNGEYDKASYKFAALRDFKDSKEKVLETKYTKALALAGEKKYNEAAQVMLTIENYSDSYEKAQEFMTEHVLVLLENGNFEEASRYIDSIGAVDNAEEIQKAYAYYDAVYLYAREEYDHAASAFQGLDNYKDSKKYFAKSVHQIYVMAGYGNINPDYLKKNFKLLETYKDDTEINAMLKHPIYIMAKMIGEWKTDNGYSFSLLPKNNSYYMDFSFPANSSRGNLSFNGSDVCSVNASTGKITVLFTVKSFSPDISIEPDTMVIVSSYNKEYILKRIK